MATITNLSTADLKTYLDTTLTTAETGLRDALNGLSGSPTQAQMISIQYEVQTWSFYIQLASTMQKEMADAFKGIVAKI